MPTYSKVGEAPFLSLRILLLPMFRVSVEIIDTDKVLLLRIISSYKFYKFCLELAPEDRSTHG